ncbi:MAG: hypothetical protein ACOXZZ_02125 [Sphaerochaetaceae bacterium]|jgi:flagellar biosynthesis protein FlhF
MQFFTVRGGDFDDALQKAYDQYGSNLRIHFRKDIVDKKGLFKLKEHSYVELVCYLAEEEKQQLEIKEIEEEKKDNQQIENPYLLKGRALLKENDFSNLFMSTLLDLVEPVIKEQKESLNDTEFELILIDKLVSLIKIDYKRQLNPDENLVLVGSSGVGKSSLIGKIGTFYTHQQDQSFKKEVTVVNLNGKKSNYDFFRDLNLRYKNYTALSDLEFEKKENSLNLYESGFAFDKEALDHLAQKEGKFILVVSAKTKKRDLEELFKTYSKYPVTNLAITKLDEASSIGTALSFAYKYDLPLLFFSDSDDAENASVKATVAKMISYIKGLKLDFETLWANQNPS